jgi:4a-hydroxytetrahydrobiopterin dehydratase
MDAPVNAREEKISQTIQKLASGHCVSCEGAKPLRAEEAMRAVKDLPGWIVRDSSIEKEFRFGSYSAGLDFACAVGRIAEVEDHHPDMLIRWRRVKLAWSTHSIKGLSQNDFIMAAKSELEYSRFGEL